MKKYYTAESAHGSETSQEMNIEKNIRELVNKKAEKDNQICLMTYESGLRDMVESLSLTPVIVSCHMCGDELTNEDNPVCGSCHVID